VNAPAISIVYCTKCNFLLRAAWIAQELLLTFSDELASVALVPGTGGVFEVRLDGELVWDRKRDGGIPDVRLIKQAVRDRIDPERSLGHTDRVSGSGDDST
jgi:selenoprotein W-related protein